MHNSDNQCKNTSTNIENIEQQRKIQKWKIIAKILTTLKLLYEQQNQD